ncbi:hypothetical protein LXL04_031127 [Taraxacum kok-saghyz]
MVVKKRGRKRMLLAVLIANSEGNILVERFNGVPGEERLHWRSFLVKLGADNLKGVKNEELLVACHKSVYIMYTVLGHVSIYLVGKDEYDELALSEAIFVVTSAIKDVCGKPPIERLFLDKYGRICLCLDEIVWKGLLENTDKDKIKRLIRFNGVPGEERLHWRSFLVKLGADNLKGVKNEELLVACHKSVYIMYTVLGHVSIYLVGKDEYDELALSEAIFVVTSAIKDVCGKPPIERLFLDKYGRICLCLDEIVWKGLLENTDKDKIKRLIRFNGVPGEERLHWRSFLVKLGADNLKGVKNEELLVACHKSVYIMYTVLGHVSIYLVGKDEYDELALSEAIFVVTSAIKDVCGKPPIERLFLDKYGRICLCLDEIVWKGLLENTDKDKIKRLIRLKPPTEF